MMLGYADFIMESETPFPRTLSVKLSGEMIKLLLDIKYGQIVFNDSLNLEFEIPENYKEWNF